MSEHTHVFDGYADLIQKKVTAGDGIQIENDRKISVSETLKKYGEENGAPTFGGAPIGTGKESLFVVNSYADLEAIEDVDAGIVIFLPQSISEDGASFNAGWYVKTENGLTPVSSLVSSEEKASYDDANSKKHTHGNKPLLDKFSEENGTLKYDGLPVIGDTSDTLVSLSLGVTYDELIVRPDWQDVPVYITGSNPVVCRLESDNVVDGFAQSEIRLMYLVDYQTGMPLPVLAVTSGGQYCVYFPAIFHDLGETLQPGWYDVNNDPLSEPPTFTDMTFDKLIVGSGTEITDLTGLSGEALCALETLSRMVNVSTDAMGGLGVKPDGVQRLNNTPVPGRRYAAVTSRNMTFPLPQIVWTGAERAFWVDLDCTSTIALTFSDTVCYEDGNNVDTTRGKHRLHIYAPAGASMWTVAETESYTDVTEDVLPERVTSFRSLTADELRAVLKYGYSNNDGDWCVRRNGIEEVWLQVGDTRPVTLTDGQEVTMRIIGIQYDDLPNGGKAALTCDFKEVLTVNNPQKAGSSARYENSGARTSAQSLLTLFPDWLQALVATAKKSQVDKSTGSPQTPYTFNDAVWLLSEEETIGDNAYPVFTDNASRVRYNQSGDLESWLMRTGDTDINYWYLININGSKSAGNLRNTMITKLAAGFCLSV